MDAIATLLAHVRRALRDPVIERAGPRWLVACSGGPDSTALLDALVTIGGRELCVASVDHGLRAEAAAEAAAVVAAARARGLGAAVLTVAVAGRSMAAARQARYDALVAEARRAGAGGLFVAHTATDQAETLLDRLVRGAGTRGLAAMARTRRIDGALVLARPLLSVTRAEVEAYVAARALPIARDPSNDDRKYRRSRLRHEVLPLLRRERPELERAIAETCLHLRADADALDEAAAAAEARLRAGDALAAAGLAALPDALFFRVVARASGVALTAVHVAALRRLCADRRGTRSLDLPGVVAERRYDDLRFYARTAASAETGTEEVAVAGPGIYLLSGMQIEISDTLWQSLGAAPLTLRHIRPGDRLHGRRLQDKLVNEKVPRPLRAALPVLARGPSVLWLGQSAMMNVSKRGQFASVS